MDALARKKFSAPKKVIPAGFGTGEEVLVEFYASHQEMRSLIAECGNFDLKGFDSRAHFSGRPGLLWTPDC